VTLCRPATESVGQQTLIAVRLPAHCSSAAAEVMRRRAGAGCTCGMSEDLDGPRAAHAGGGPCTGTRDDALVTRWHYVSGVD
jgi:hypothetical protein